MSLYQEPKLRFQEENLSASSSLQEEKPKNDKTLHPTTKGILL